MLKTKLETYRTVMYLRLSREDERRGESDSIQNQRSLIREFISKHPDLYLVNEYVDDGFSGTNMNRPAFAEMKKAIDDGKIDCVIVKDLSRLGRNYIETGRLLKQFFPENQIRFIAVNDNYDSNQPEGDADDIIIPFKTIINDAYSRDISLKILSSLHAKQKDGKFIGSFASYGYVKDPKDKNHLVIDEYAAGIVQMIFDLKLSGRSLGWIASELNKMNVLSPMAYKRAEGLNYNSGWSGGDQPKWYASTVRNVLTNEFYTGTTVQGKHKKINYKVKKSRTMDPENWVRVAGTHQEIIDRELFEQVQRILRMDTRIIPAQEKTDIFSGILKCADCGENMVRRSAWKNGKQYIYYHCSTAKSGEGCSSHLINREKLERSVLDAINRQIETVIQIDEYLHMIKNVPSMGSQSKVLQSQLDAISKELDRYLSFKTKLYIDMQDDVVSKEDYIELNQRFTEKVKSVEQARKEVLNKIDKLNDLTENDYPWIRKMKSFHNLTSLDRKMIIFFVESIYVIDKYHVEVRFRYADEIKSFMEIMQTGGIHNEMR